MSCAGLIIAVGLFYRESMINNFSNKMNRDWLRYPQQKENPMMARPGYSKLNEGIKASSSIWDLSQKYTGEKDERILEIRRKYEDVPFEVKKKCEDVPFEAKKKCEDVPFETKKKEEDVPFEAKKKCEDVPFETKKKYEDVAVQMKKNYDSVLKPVNRNLREGHNPPKGVDDKILNKLISIKTELKKIPNWKEYAQSILFEEDNHHYSSSRQYQRLDSRSDQKKSSHPGQKRVDHRQSAGNSPWDQERDRGLQGRQATSIDPIIWKYLKFYEKIGNPRKGQHLKSGISREQNGTESRTTGLSGRIEDLGKRKESLNANHDLSQSKWSHFESSQTNGKVQNRHNQLNGHKYNQRHGHANDGLHLNAHTSREVSRVTNSMRHYQSHNKIAQPEDPVQAASRQELPRGSMQRFDRDRRSSKKDTKKEAKKEAKKNQGQEAQRRSLLNSYSQRERRRKGYEREQSTDSFSDYVLEEQQAILDRQRRKGAEGRMEKKKIGSGHGPNIEGLAAALSEQARLDEDFRNCRLWLQSCTGADKWQQLSNVLRECGVQVPMNQLKDSFQVSEHETNPFFCAQEQPSNFEQVAEGFVGCLRHWKKKVHHKFQRRALIAEGLGQELDLDKKGFLVLEDVVRFLNMVTGTFFRNRDVFSIFQRLARGEQSITFEQFLGEASC